MTAPNTAATDESLRAQGYARPEALVTTAWLADHLDDPTVRIIESDEDVLLYDLGHIPGAQKIDWHQDLNDAVQRDYVDRAQFEALVRRLGIDESSTVVFYGDKNNWWATYAFWVFQLFGFANARVLDGGRMKWEQEGRPLTDERPSYPPTRYTAPEREDARIRAFMPDVHAHLQRRGKLIDVRSPAEFTGEKTHMAEYPQEGTLRGGHIPTAASVPWARAAAEDARFRSREELEAVYRDEVGLAEDDDIIAYCRIGERSSHTWFVLRELLGKPDVKNYDGSWVEYGSLVGVPIEK